MILKWFQGGSRASFNQIRSDFCWFYSLTTRCSSRAVYSATGEQLSELFLSYFSFSFSIFISRFLNQTNDGQFESNFCFRAVSEQFQSSFRAVLEHFCSFFYSYLYRVKVGCIGSRAVLEQFYGTWEVSVQFQCSFTAVLRPLQSFHRANWSISPFQGSFRALSVQFQSSVRLKPATPVEFDTCVRFH